jgi:hypothetical protein
MICESRCHKEEHVVEDFHLAEEFGKYFFLNELWTVCDLKDLWVLTR